MYAPQRFYLARIRWPLYQQPAETISGRQKYLKKKSSHTEATGLYDMVHVCSVMNVSP